MPRLLEPWGQGCGLSQALGGPQPPGNPSVTMGAWDALGALNERQRASASSPAFRSGTREAAVKSEQNRNPPSLRLALHLFDLEWSLTSTTTDSRGRSRDKRLCTVPGIACSCVRWPHDANVYSGT